MSSLKNYRYDIDGLRAISVIAVIIFHLGFLPNGYLGVDVFFVISGYLITKIMFKESIQEKFSLIEFYKRRIRRILPLVVSATIVSVIVAMFLMLPDDLENFSQSVIATNFMANNILLRITTGDYWDVVNEYKPLMHTWSLAVEEQFYFILPLLFLLLNRVNTKWVAPVLLLLSGISLVIFLMPNFAPSASKFYYIQYRFYEVGFGGLLAIYLGDKLYFKNFKGVFLLILILLMYFDLEIHADILLVIVVLISGLLLISENSSFEKLLIENKVVVYIGKISFSLYIWHQIVFAFLRYSGYPNLQDLEPVAVALSLTVVLSILSYHFVENYFRDKKKVPFKHVFSFVLLGTILSSGISAFVIFRKGIIRDVPELSLYIKDINSYKGNIHIDYNSRIYAYNKPFSTNGKTKVLIIGNSFARDWANVLLESRYREKIEISYIFDVEAVDPADKRFEQADNIFFSELDMDQYRVLEKRFSLDFKKVWNVGTKSFGANNGIVYTKRNEPGYCLSAVTLDYKFLNLNAIQKRQWGSKYIDMIGMLTKTAEVPVFTDQCKFISQDCRHLTQHGAKFYASKLEMHNYFYW